MSEVINLHPAPAAGKSELARTPSFQAIEAMLGAVQRFGMLGLILGQPGVGKSTAIGAYAQEHRHVTVVRLTKAGARVRATLIHLLKEMGRYIPTQSSDGELLEDVVNQLSWPNSRGDLLIVDEAQHADDDTLETFRDIFDTAPCGLVLVGHTDLRERLKRARFAQIWGRVGATYYLDGGPPADDVQALAAHFGIEGQQARKLLAGAARKFGGLHHVASMVAIARKDSDDGKLTYNALRRAAQLIGVVS